MKILFYGNCQTEVVMAAMAANNPDLQLEYAGNSNRVLRFDPERTQRLMAWSDHIVTQPVMNTENPDHHPVLRARFADKITFMPYLWIDGLFSLCGLPENRALAREGSFVGQAHVIDHLQKVGYQQTLQDFRNGLVDFQHPQRFDRSITELAAREAFCDVRVTPFLRANYRDRVVMLTHNHPHPVVVNEVTRLIAGRLGLKHVEIGPETPAAYAAITLPEYGKVFSPFVAADLGLRHAYDLQWQRRGQEIIGQIAEGLDGLADRPSRQDLQARTTERRDLIDDRQAQNEALRAGNDELRAQNAERQALVAEKQAQTEALKDQNDAQRLQNAERQALLIERQAQTEAIKHQTDEQKAQNTVLKALNAERAALIAEKQAQAEALKAQTRALQAQTEAQKSQIEVLRAQNAERHALNAERQAQIEAMQALAMEKQKLMAERQAHRAAAQAKVGRQRAQRTDPEPPGSDP